MRLPSKKHGKVKVYYCREPEKMSYSYTLKGKTVKQRLDFLLQHIGNQRGFVHGKREIRVYRDGVAFYHNGMRLFYDYDRSRGRTGRHWQKEKPVIQVEEIAEDYFYDQ